MKKFHKTFAIILASVLTLSGCVADPYPEMTDAEYAVVVHYAASLLTRYSKGTKDKLAYLATDYTPEYLMAEALSTFEQTQAPEPEGNGTEEQQNPQPANDPVPQPENNQPEQAGDGDRQEQDPDGQDIDNNDQQEQTPDAQGGAENTDNTGDTENNTEGSDNTEAVTPVANYTGIGESGLQTLASNVRVEYTGYSVKSVYPDTQAQGAVAAAPGDKLLVVDFSVQNLTDVPVAFNTANRNPQFKLNINNNVQGFTMVTMIPNDLSGMDRELAPGERTDAVLLMEVPESLAKSVDTLDLVIKIRGEEEQTVKLE